MTRRYFLSQTTFITLGIAIGDNLAVKVKTFLHNKNDFFVELTSNALSQLFSEDIKRRFKQYFERKTTDLNPIQLDQHTTLYFVRIFEKLGISIKDHNRNIQVSFLNPAAEQLLNLKLTTKCYTSYLNSITEDVVVATIKVKSIFDSFFYSCDNINNIVKKILKSSEYNENDIIEMELICICYKRFLCAIEREKKEALVIVEE